MMAERVSRRAILARIGAGLLALAATPTAVVNGRIRQLDYIFHCWIVGQPPHIDPVPLTPIDRDTPMPGPDHPSDHLPLAAAFTLTPA